MRHVLFLDDEPKSLAGLERSLDMQRRSWQMSFVSTPEAALERLAKGPFDVIVSDLRPPRGNNPKLLASVRERFPNVVRIMLTQGNPLEAALIAVPVAHQFLTKPCDADVLRVAVERACNLKGLLHNELVDRLVGGVQQLPALPRTYAALTSALGDPSVSIDQLAAIVEQDVAVSARILQLVNSPLFGLMRHVSTVRTGMSYLGIDTLRGLVLSIEVAKLFEHGVQAKGFSFEDLYAHAYLTLQIARNLPTDKYLKDAAGVAALMHDIGKLILATRLSGQFKDAFAKAQSEGRPLYQVEEETLGVTHGEIGAYLLGFWGLPFPVVEAVAYHHSPSRLQVLSFDAVATVHVANGLAHEAQSSQKAVGGGIDLGYLKALGFAEEVPAWKSMAAKLNEPQSGSSAAIRSRVTGEKQSDRNPK